MVLKGYDCVLRVFSVIEGVLSVNNSVLMDFACH